MIFTFNSSRYRVSEREREGEREREREGENVSKCGDEGLVVGAPVGLDMVGNSAELKAVGQSLVVGQRLCGGSPIDIYGRAQRIKTPSGPHTCKS